MGWSYFFGGKGGVARRTPLAAFQKSMSQTKTYFRTIKNLCFPFIDFIEVPILEPTDLMEKDLGVAQ